ncbi:hypothetical protein C8R47DRAFT_1205012 [Mycena vitilis]|nr:hypothetical protein C8R47DRAFT_1205012 [Mycena vitilis]
MAKAWRKQVAKWQADMRELDMVSENESIDGRGAVSEDEDMPASGPIPARARPRRAPRSWLPTTSLFAGVVPKPITLARRDRVVSEESLYMELLAAEHSDEEPDACAQEGSGDDYDG